MGSTASNIGVFILAKNEEANIGRCLDSLAGSGWDVHVLDSGSTDKTESIVAQFSFAKFHAYNYTNHCNAYNEILSAQGKGYGYIIIFDADMTVPEVLRREIEAVIAQGVADWDVLEASIKMFVEGLEVSYGSLYPTKPFLFRTASGPYFIGSGHAEKVAPEFMARVVNAPLGHDDRKPYSSYLQSQARYADNLIARGRQDNVSIRDRLRIETPLLIFLVPLVSYVIKLGFLSGRSGVLYALDRLIAEAVMYRQALADRVKRKVTAKEGADATENGA